MQSTYGFDDDDCTSRHRSVRGAQESGLCSEDPLQMRPTRGHDQEGYDRVQKTFAEIAAIEAMKESRVRFSSTLGRNPRRVKVNHEKSVNNLNSSPIRTPRRHKPTSLALLNKTLRSMTPTKISRQSIEPTAQTEHLHSKSISAMAPEASDFGATNENYGALPSSYRKIRKAKSMQSPRRNALSNQDNTVSKPLQGGRTLRNATSFAALPISNLHLRLKQSLPFLRSKSASTMHHQLHDGSGSYEEAVQLARAQFLEEVEHRRMNDMASRSDGVKMRVDRRSFKNSVRTSLSVGSNKSPSGKYTKSQSPQSDAARRSFSFSVRDRLRRALGLSMKGKEGLPPQQLEAQRSHFRDFDDYSDAVNGFDAYLVNEKSQSTRNSVYRTIDQQPDALEDLDNLPPILQSNASRESLHSNSRSRVTSWTNSSTTGSIGFRSGQIERNRLSIIKEDGGPHQPSSSAGRHIGGVEVFPEPLQSVANDGQVLPSVDSRRVYSALIKRISQEDAEVERTRIALEAVNLEHEQAGGDFADLPSTIRTVHSSSSLTSAVTDTRRRRSRSRSRSSRRIEPKMTPELQKENIEKRKEKLADQERQSSFFPFSGESNPSAPSPFKRFLNERRDRQRNSSKDSEHDNSSVVINRQPSNTLVNRPRFGLSSESIYSRTTNGGVNEQYIPPIGSSEQVFAEIEDDNDVTGMATITPATFFYSHSRPPFIMTDSADLRSGPGIPVLPEECTRGTHTREQAQMSSDESCKDAANSGPFGLVEDSLSSTTCLINGRHPLLDLKLLPSGNTRKPIGLLSGSKSDAELLTKASTEALSNISNNAEDGSTAGGSLRKLSPGNLAKMLKERRSHNLMRQRDIGKENNPTDQQDSPPLSTPGRLHLQFRNGASNGKLRKRASETAFNSRKGLQSTPQSASISTATTPSRLEESPSEKVRDHLVARLSRPFNMDVPPQNRPFDSMYLGKRTPGHPDSLGNSRLSVAPRPSPEQGVSSAKIARGSPNTEATALPSVSSVDRSSSKVWGLFGSKRMVSNFLKSRRGDRSCSEGAQDVVGASPAFI